MPPFRKPTLVTLRRSLPNQAWGFRLGGGAEIGQPFQIQKVTPDSLAYLGGLSEGDELVRIGNISLRGLTHDEVQQIILRCNFCIDLFVFRDDGNDITPRFVLVNQPELFSKTETYPRLTSAPISPLMPTSSSMFNNFSGEVQDNSNLVFSSVVDGSQNNCGSTSPRFENTVDHRMQQPNTFQSGTSTVETKLGTPNRDTRVFGVPNRGGSKSPFSVPNLSRENSNSPNKFQTTHNFAAQPSPAISQSIPSTPAVHKEFSFPHDNDFNNNPPTNGDKKVFGLPSRGGSKVISPLGNHGVQPVLNERKVFGLNSFQRRCSLSSSCERDWKEPLPIVNIPNTDQLLPSQTKSMQTYINQTPPTEKNLRPSLIGLERRRIRPVWPPPHPSRTHRAGIQIEGRDSPNTKMYNWPPRAQSVDRDFGYGEGQSSSYLRGATPDRCDSSFSNSRVGSVTKVWPPPSNATPAGASGYIPDENDQENYAYNPNGDSLPGMVSSHIPRTYRTPPGTQHLVVNDF
ncbi:hypothetical protein BLOT_003747 [Blomia tropicalis]|nr:hypothetical protein BLOT_003747 [Blomia tropicalis]